MIKSREDYYKQKAKHNKTKITPENYQSRLSVHEPVGSRKGEDNRLEHHKEMAAYHADKQESGINPEHSADKEAYHRDMAAKLESQKTAPMGALPYSETPCEPVNEAVLGVNDCIKDDAICECGALYKEHLKKEQFKIKKDIAAVSTPSAAPGVGTGVAMI